VATLRASLDAVFGVLEQTPFTGSAACRMISDVYDQAIAERFETAAEGETLALIATGGWARRELAPYSDIDFVVLHDRDEALAKRVSDRLLYPLWDERLSIGHAVRDPRALARLAKDDLATATALLDARHIAGSQRLTSELVRIAMNPNELIAQLAAAQQARHDRFGASLYLLEPNLKQGIGALRDLSTALWAAAVRWHPPRPNQAPRSAEALIAELTAMGHLNHRQARILTGARDFLLQIRALVQLTTRRRLDQLTFEVQEAIAPGLYPAATSTHEAVEALMRDYYLHARGVVGVTERLLEAARVASRKSPKVAQVDAAFITLDGELAVRDPGLFVERPAEMVRLFRVAVAGKLAVSGHTRELVAEAIARDPAPLAADPVAARLVHDAVVDLRDTAQPSLLEVMHQLGILAAVMPGWAPCTARVQHDLYHVYTVDQHQLYALAMQKQLARGELADVHPTATELWREVTRPGPLLLGTLLHDIGKPLGKGHAEKGAVLAGEIARKLGMPESEIELTEFLVRQHLTMSHLSQRRDLADPEVIERFAEKVGDDEHLVQLYLLTLCDTAMTAPDNLTAWKAELLRELVMRTRAHLAQLRDPVELASREIARHAQLVEQARASTPPIALEVHCWPAKGHSELAIVAPDAPGVLATIAGALTASRVDVLGAVLGHVDLPEGRLVTDVFHVRDLKGEAIPEDDARWQRLAGDLRGLLAGPPDPGAVAALIARRRPPSSLPRRVTPAVATEVRLHDDSTRATIVEVFTRDRMGVLYAITQTLAELGLDISLAKISTEGEKVADVFYVTRAGKHLTDEAERARLVTRLTAALA
jgi:[protein-PII] uridylyltransferase